MTRPDDAPLNLATSLPCYANPTDLGPKAYVAFGTPRVGPRPWGPQDWAALTPC